MKSRLFSVVASVALVAGSVFAADREQMSIGQLSLNDVLVTSSAAELNTLDASAKTAVAATTVTNGSTITLSAASPVVMFLGSGQANGLSNVVSIALPYPINQEFTFVASPSTTNTIQFADTGSVLALGALIELSATDSCVIRTLATNVAVKVGGNDN